MQDCKEVTDSRRYPLREMRKPQCLKLTAVESDRNGGEPSAKEALKDCNAASWSRAMKEEVRHLKN